MTEQSFAEWIREAANPILVQKVLVYTGCTVAGQIGHALKKWLLDELCNPIDWFLSAPKRTVLAVMANIGTGLGYALSGTLDGSTWGALISLAITTGYAADSVTNRGEER